MASDFITKKMPSQFPMGLIGAIILRAKRERILRTSCQPSNFQAFNSILNKLDIGDETIACINDTFKITLAINSNSHRFSRKLPFGALRKMNTCQPGNGPLCKILVATRSNESTAIAHGQGFTQRSSIHSFLFSHYRLLYKSRT